MKKHSRHKLLSIQLWCLFIIFATATAVQAKVITQFVPTLTITENYSDNLFHSGTNELDDYYTVASLDLSLGFIGKNGSTFLGYNPTYTKYDEYDFMDSWDHLATIESEYLVTKRTTVTFSENYRRILNRTITSDTLHRHDISETSAGLEYAFGQQNTMGVNYEYSFDDYETANADEYKTHNPSAFFEFWFTTQWGVKLDGAYERTKYDTSTNEPETWSGDIKLTHRLNRHFDVFARYAHTYTDRSSGEQTIYHPSVGINWSPTEDSGIEVGIGVLFQEWDNTQSTKTEDFFLELDAYKDFEFSRRGVFSITGSSGYTPTSSDAASLGFELHYRAGALLTYQLTRQLTADIQAAYQITQFDDPNVNRQDDTLTAGCGLSWSPLRWMTLSVNYSFTDFQTDAASRQDYQENVGMVSVSFTSPRPVRFDSSSDRSRLEGQLFD